MREDSSSKGEEWDGGAGEDHWLNPTLTLKWVVLVNIDEDYNPLQT